MKCLLIRLTEKELAILANILTLHQDIIFDFLADNEASKKGDEIKQERLDKALVSLVGLEAILKGLLRNNFSELISYKKLVCLLKDTTEKIKLLTQEK